VSGAAALTWRQYRLERRMFWRNPVAAFFNFVLPLLFLAFFGAIFSANQKNLNIIVPGIAGMSVMSTTFVALAFNTTFLREQGVLKRIRGTPMPPGSYLGGLALSAVTNTVIQIAIVTVAGRTLFGTGWPRDWIALIVFVALGVACFASLGVALSHAIPNFESAAVYVNVIFLPMLFVSGTVYDATKEPQFLRSLADALPLKHLIDGLSGAMVKGQGLGANGTALAVLAIWTLVGTVLAIRGFSWEARRG
jgi:ABC-2 type transport system permease protein